MAAATRIPRAARSATSSPSGCARSASTILACSPTTEIRDAIKGHKPRTEGEEYGGDVEWDMMWPEIKRQPRYDAKPPTEQIVHTPARAKATSDRAATRKRAKAKTKAAVTS